MLKSLQLLRPKITQLPDVKIERSVSFGKSVPTPSKLNLASTAQLLEKISTTNKPDAREDKMYVFDKNGNKIIL